MAVKLERDPTEEGFYNETIEHISKLLNLGSMWFTLGIRGYYFAIPFLFWYFGPYQLLTSTILLIAAVSYGDSNNSMKLKRLPSRAEIV
jgi:uncharacterized membrane protein